MAIAWEAADSRCPMLRVEGDGWIGLEWERVSTRASGLPSARVRGSPLEMLPC